MWSLKETLRVFEGEHKVKGQKSSYQADSSNGIGINADHDSRIGLSPIDKARLYSFMFVLSDDERESLKAQHRLERDGRIRDRIKAVLLRD